MTQFVLVHSLLADANILPRIAMLVLRSRRLDLVLLQYGLGKAALVLLATGAMFACFRVVTSVDYNLLFLDIFCLVQES